MTSNYLHKKTMFVRTGKSCNMLFPSYIMSVSARLKINRRQ